MAWITPMLRGVRKSCLLQLFLLSDKSFVDETFVHSRRFFPLYLSQHDVVLQVLNLKPETPLPYPHYSSTAYTSHRKSASLFHPMTCVGVHMSRFNFNLSMVAAMTSFVRSCSFFASYWGAHTQYFKTVFPHHNLKSYKYWPT